MGHDFRPDYKKLSILRQLYPGVPILAVTATCSRKVLPDLLQTLGMKPVTAANGAPPSLPLRAGPCALLISTDWACSRSRRRQRRRDRLL